MSLDSISGNDVAYEDDKGQNEISNDFVPYS